MSLQGWLLSFFHGPAVEGKYRYAAECRLNPTALGHVRVAPHTPMVPIKIVLNLLALASMAFAGGETRANLAVSAVVRPAARIEVQSATSVTVYVTMNSNAEGLVWTAAASCSSPENPKSLASSGIHHLSFSPEQVEGKNLVCFASSDNILRTSARLM